MFSVSPTLSRFVSMLGRVQRRLRPRSEAYTLVIWLGLLYTLCAWMLWVLATSPCLPTIDGWDAEGARPGTVHHWIETMEQHSLNTANETYMQTNDAGSECSCECRDFWLWNCSYSYSYTLRVVYLLIAIHNRSYIYRIWCVWYCWLTYLEWNIYSIVIEAESSSVIIIRRYFHTNSTSGYATFHFGLHIIRGCFCVQTGR